jgi:hypothetical protein
MGEWVQIWWMYFAFTYENRQMKLVDIVLRRWGRGKREQWKK